MTEPRVRIFVSSPADLDHERALIKDIVAQLATEYLPYFKLQAVLWEEEALTAAQSFQAGLLRPSECEIVLVMLWTRLGTPLADDPYGGMTGTEWEFVDAVGTTASADGPEVLVYKKTAPRLVDVTNAEVIAAAVADRERLDAFFRAHFYNPDGSFSRAFRQFDSDRSLRELVQVQLRKLLNRRISAERGRRPGAGDWHDNPFRAAAPYLLRDEPIFVGRETETRELVARLDAVRGAGRGLLLISGPSGVGKSSLVRAGLLPLLVRPFLFAGISGCRWCLLDGGQADPLAVLAQALLSTNLLGSALGGFGLDEDRLTRLLEAEPAVAAGQVHAALARLDADAGRGPSGPDGRQQLVLILDPLDGLLGDAVLAAPRTQTFIAALAALAAQDAVWVIATLRGDLLHQVACIPALAALLDDQGWYALGPPPAARIRQVIEIPARVAGIEYEGADGGAGRGLVDLLEGEASGLTHWPALLQPLLDDLYERARAVAADPVEGGGARFTLSIADYRALGGVAGTTLRRAEALWAGLDPAARAALPMLCRALLALEGDPAARPIARAGDLRALARDPNCARLVQALVEARLVVTEGLADPAQRRPCAQGDDGLMDLVTRLARETRDEWRARLFPRRTAAASTAAGLIPDLIAGAAPPQPSPAPSPQDAPAVPDWRDYRPTAQFMHTVLFDAWTPIRDWLAAPKNRRDLQLRFQITRQARLWKRTDCNREYLLGEVGYAGARQFADAFASELEPLEQAFLQRSLRHLREQRRRNHWVRLAGLTLGVSLVVASLSAFWAWEASRAATLNLHRSQLNAADLAINQGNTPAAIGLALDAGGTLPLAATDTLSRAFSDNRLIAMAQGAPAVRARPRSPDFRDDGQQLVTLDERDGARQWDLDDNRFVRGRQLAPPGLPIHAVRFAQAEGQSLFLGIGETGVWRLPAAAGAAPDWTCGAGPGGVITLDPTRRYLALSHAAPERRFGLCVLDLARPGPPLWDRALHQREIRAVAFSPDGGRLVTASRDGTARVVDSLTGEERLVLPSAGPPGRALNRAIFDQRGQRIATAGTDERVRLYDRNGAEIAVLGEVERQGQRFRIHQGAVRDLAFVADDRYLLAGDDAGQLVRWDLRDREAEVLGQHRLSVEQVRTSPAVDPRAQEPLVLTASLDKTARLWGVESGRLIAVFSHDGAVSDARFSADGGRIMTSSQQDGSGRLWSIEPTEGLAFRLPHDDHVTHLDQVRPPPELDPDPGAVLLASGSYDGKVQVWRYDSRAPRAAPVEIWSLGGHQARVRRVAFSVSGRLLASAAYDGSARVWNMLTGGGCALEPVPNPSVESAPAPATGPAPHPAAAGSPGPVTDQATTTAEPARVEFYRVLFAPDERWLLTTSNDSARPVRLWDPAACAELPLPSALEQGPAKVQAATVASGPAGIQVAATGDDDGMLRVVRRAPAGDWTLVCRLAVHQAAITDLAMAPDGNSIASVSEDGGLALTALADGVCGEPRHLDGGGAALVSVRFSPDGTALVTAATDARAQVWNSRSGEQIAELKGHKDRVSSAQFSPDGRWIVTASRDGTLRLWQRPGPRTGRETTPLTETSFLVLEGDLGGAGYAQFSPDGNSIAATYWKNAVMLWRLWSPDAAPDPAIERVWGADRARLALIREAVRFRRDNGLGVRVEDADLSE